MAIYYIDTTNGNNSNNGLSEITPVRDMNAISINPGDTVLFKRGSFVRGKLNTVQGEPSKPITYSAYGEGEPPTFCGSINLSESSIWHEESENIWYAELSEHKEVANFVFDKSDSYAALRWNKEELSQQGDFFDNCFGTASKSDIDYSEHRVYLYSEKNPGKYYSNIECVVCDNHVLADNGHDVIFENLHFLNGAVHAIAGLNECRRLTIRKCIFENIGGAVWSKGQKIRFGNAVEAWDIGENIEVYECCFNNIYDSAVTHQGSTECKQADKFIIKDNLFIKCGMASYEQRDKMPIHAEFNNNLCIDTGEGFSKLGEEMPRYSEIWPEPMGHHVFIWRIEKSDNGHLEIKNNIFANSPYGAAIYSIASTEAETAYDIEQNTYYTENTTLLNRLNGINYKSFAEYSEKDAEYKQIDTDELIKSWHQKHMI